MITKPNNKILFHSLLISLMSTVLIFFIENMTLKYVVVSYILINLLLNKTTYLKLTNSNLEIYRNIFFVIPTFRYKIRLKDIRKIYLVNYQDVYQDNFLKHPEFEGSIITKLITGYLFYKPDNILALDLNKNKKLEFVINSNKKNLIKILTQLQPYLRFNNNIMEINKKEISKKSINIIMNEGIDELTVNNLAFKLGLNQKELKKVIKSNEDLLLMVFKSFEDDLKEFIQEISVQSETPSIEIDNFFKGLYNVFLQKPYYLSIIFDKRLKGKNSKVRKSVKSMKNTIENYLTILIESGKNNNSFKTKTPTNILVNKMLTEFRLLMQNEQYINEMILDLQILRKSND